MLGPQFKFIFSEAAWYPPIPVFPNLLMVRQLRRYGVGGSWKRFWAVAFS